MKDFEPIAVVGSQRDTRLMCIRRNRSTSLKELADYAQRQSR